MGEAVDLLNLFGEESGNTGEKDPASTNEDPSSVNIHIIGSPGMRLRGFARIDELFLKPILLRKFTDEVLIL